MLNSNTPNAPLLRPIRQRLCPLTHARIQQPHWADPLILEPGSVMEEAIDVLRDERMRTPAILFNAPERYTKHRILRLWATREPLWFGVPVGDVGEWGITVLARLETQSSRLGVRDPLIALACHVPFLDLRFPRRVFTGSEYSPADLRLCR